MRRNSKFGDRSWAARLLNRQKNRANENNDCDKAMLFWKTLKVRKFSSKSCVPSNPQLLSSLGSQCAWRYSLLFSFFPSCSASATRWMSTFSWDSPTCSERAKSDQTTSTARWAMPSRRSTSTNTSGTKPQTPGLFATTFVTWWWLAVATPLSSTRLWRTTSSWQWLGKRSDPS